MFCAQCGTESVSGQRFCGQCGAPLAGLADGGSTAPQPEPRTTLPRSLGPIARMKIAWTTLTSGIRMLIIGTVVVVLVVGCAIVVNNADKLSGSARYLAHFDLCPSLWR